VRKKRNKRNKITKAKTLRKTGFHSNAIRTQAPANRNGRSKQPIIEASNQTLAFLAVFVYATHATQSIALRALHALRLDGNRALVGYRNAIAFNKYVPTSKKIQATGF